jgi:hypothetical protein
MHNPIIPKRSYKEANLIIYDCFKHLKDTDRPLFDQTAEPHTKALLQSILPLLGYKGTSVQDGIQLVYQNFSEQYQTAQQLLKKGPSPQDLYNFVIKYSKYYDLAHPDASLISSACRDLYGEPAGVQYFHAKSDQQIVERVHLQTYQSFVKFVLSRPLIVDCKLFSLLLMACDPATPYPLLLGIANVLNLPEIFVVDKSKKSIYMTALCQKITLEQEKHLYLIANLGHWLTPVNQGRPQQYVGIINQGPHIATLDEWKKIASRELELELKDPTKLQDLKALNLNIQKPYVWMFSDPNNIYDHQPISEAPILPPLILESAPSAPPPAAPHSAAFIATPPSVAARAPAAPLSKPPSLAPTCTACGNTQGVDWPNLKQCGSCHVVQYCSKACQKRHWPTHKTDCVKKI